jgi:hypothetical protein
MATKAKSTKGTRLQIGDGGGSEVFTTIAECKNFTGPSDMVEQINVTSFDSSSQEYISTGQPDSGEVSFDMNFVGSNAQQQQLRTDCRSGVLRNFKLIKNDHATTPTTITFAAIVTKLEPKGDVGSAYSQSCSLKVSGTPSWSYAPS